MNGSFGEYLKGLRMSRKMSIRKLAMKSGVSSSYISNIEIGKRNVPTPDAIKKLSVALNITQEEMMIKAGHLREQKDVVYDFTTKMIEAMQDAKKIDLTQFEDYEFIIDGQVVSKEYMEKLLTVARPFLPPHPPS